MLRPVMAKPTPRVPTLMKVRGDDSIERRIPIAEAQFLIGKSWDVSLHLNFSEVREKHCTIEKISADAWTLSSHDNVTLQINDYVLSSGCTKLLKCGDYIRLSSNIMFQFTCSSLTCDLCNTTTSIENEVESIPSMGPSDRRTKFNYEQLINSSKQLKYLQNFKDSSLNFYQGINDANLSHNSRLEGYRNLVNSSEPLFKLENNSDEYKNLHLKVLGDIVTYQCDFIEKLRNQLNEFFNDFKSVKDRSSYLEGTNLHLKNENLILRTKLARYIKNAEALRNQNLNLQAEIVTLNEKQEKLKSVIDSKKKETADANCCQDMSLNEVGRNCEAVMEVKTKLTKLLETEFKCTICDEVFVEAMVTNCGHTFCEQCLSTWKVIKPNCPICRSTLIKENKSLAVDSYLNNIMPFASSELRTNWLKVVNERKTASENLRKNPAPKRKYTSSMVDSFFDETRYNLDRLIMRLNSTET